MKVDELDNGEFNIQLDEIFDFKKVESFRRSYESIDAKKVKLVNVDFTNTRYMDSSALGMLLNVQSYFKASNVSIIIKNPNEQIRKIMAISRFDQKFTIKTN